MASAKPTGSRDTVVGALFLTFFGGFWTIFSLAERAAPLPLLGFAAVVLIVLLGMSIQMWRRSQPFPANADVHTRARRTSLYRQFGAVVAVEAIAIGTASWLFGNANHPEFIAPVVGLIVGLHFLPLARLFEQPAYAWLGAWFVVLSGLAAVALLAGYTLGALENWSIVIGLLNGVALWVTAAYVLSAEFRTLHTHIPEH